MSDKKLDGLVEVPVDTIYKSARRAKLSVYVRRKAALIDAAKEALKPSFINRLLGRKSVKMTLKEAVKYTYTKPYDRCWDDVWKYLGWSSLEKANKLLQSCRVIANGNKTMLLSLEMAAFVNKWK